MTAFGRKLLAAQESAYDGAAAAMRSQRFRTLLLDTARWIADGEWTRTPLTAERAASPIGDFARRALHKRRSAVKKRAKSLNWDDPISRHKLRIEIKKVRYASEFFVGVVHGPRGRRDRFIDALERLQDKLGRLNDIRVGGEVARSAVNGSDAGDGAGFGAGIVVGRTSLEVAKLAKSAQRACHAFLATRPWW
jgi:CHAD domain-containing protein